MAIRRLVLVRKRHAGVLASCLVLCGTAAVVSLPARPALAAVAPPPSGALVVGTVSATCPDPGFATITAAMTAATAGGTIYVCAGTYSEHVDITKNVTLLGAQWGVDARSRHASAADETVISSAAGEFTYSSGARTGTIDGFTLQGSTATPFGDEVGILALFSTGTGYTWVNNIITGNTTGINFQVSGTGPTTIEHNQITGNNATGSGAGNGIFFTSGPANNASIIENDFAGNAAAINTTGNGVVGTQSDHLLVKDNTSVDDANFIVLFLTRNAQITGNSISWTDPADTRAQTAIYVSGGNSDVSITGNVIDGGASTGVNLNDQFFTTDPSSGISVTGNTITRRLNGIRIPVRVGTAQPVSDVTIDGNNVHDAGVDDSTVGNGIWLQDGAGVIVNDNFITGSTGNGCLDETTGAQSAGTANTWTSNVGETSSPADLCTKPATPNITGVISSSRLAAGGKVHQSVTVTGTGGQPGTLTWGLYGPVPAQGDSCAGVSFASAPLLAQDALPLTGDGQAILPDVTLAKAGCYTYSDVLTGRTYTAAPSIPRGQAQNTALAFAKQENKPPVHEKMPPLVPVTG